MVSYFRLAVSGPALLTENHNSFSLILHMTSLLTGITHNVLKRKLCGFKDSLAQGGDIHAFNTRSLGINQLIYKHIDNPTVSCIMYTNYEHNINL